VTRAAACLESIETHDATPVLGRARSVLPMLCGALLLSFACQSGPPPTLAERGHAAVELGDFKGADALFVAALEQDPGDVSALHGRARVALNQRDPEAALAFFLGAARHDRSYLARAGRADYLATLHEAALGRLRARRPKAALAALRAIQQMDPHRKGLSPALAEALTGRAEELAMHGQRREAIEGARRSISWRLRAATARRTDAYAR